MSARAAAGTGRAIAVDAPDVDARCRCRRVAETAAPERIDSLHPSTESITMPKRPLTHRCRFALAFAIATFAATGYGATAAPLTDVVRQERALESSAALLEELERVAPEGISVLSATAVGPELVLTGHAENNADLARFIKELSAVAWLRTVDLKSAVAAGGKVVFEISATRSESEVGIDEGTQNRSALP